MRSLTVKIILTIVSLIYVISPYDIVPDMVPVLGQADDLFLLGALLWWLLKKPAPRQRDAGADENTRERAEAKAVMSPYEILNIPPDADEKEIQAAYRQASQQYHPDKVAHLGPELQALAETKFLEIQRAYDVIRRKRKF